MAGSGDGTIVALGLPSVKVTEGDGPFVLVPVFVVVLVAVEGGGFDGAVAGGMVSVLDGVADAVNATKAVSVTPGRVTLVGVVVAAGVSLAVVAGVEVAVSITAVDKGVSVSDTTTGEVGDADDVALGDEVAVSVAAAAPVAPGVSDPVQVGVSVEVSVSLAVAVHVGKSVTADVPVAVSVMLVGVGVEVFV